MDRERKKRIRTIKLIVTEIIMVITIVGTVIILTFLAMGYNVNKDGDLAQSGLLQLKSLPSGAVVQIDGEVLMAKTNMSRMLAGGKHNVELSKNGYSTWSKEITSEPGRLLKIEYPRLFLEHRTTEKVREYEKSLKFISYSDDGSYILYQKDGDSNFTLLNIRGDEAIETSLEISKYLGKGTIEKVIWNKNNDRVIMQAKNGDKNEWLLVNVRDPNNSINLTTQFKLNFSKVSFFTNSGDRLIVLENGNLRSISVGEKTISQVFAEGVEDFYNEETTLFYVGKYQETIVPENSDATNATTTKTIRALIKYEEGNQDILVSELKDGAKITFTLSEYLGRRYLNLVVDNHLYIYRGNYPTENRNLSEMETVIDVDLDYIPEEMAVWTEDQLVMIKNGNKISMFDAELSQLNSFEAESGQVFFLDKHLLGIVADNKLIARDFDGTNRRELATATMNGIISRNDKWLYYGCVVEGKTNIFKEKILD